MKTTYTRLPRRVNLVVFGLAILTLLVTACVAPIPPAAPAEPTPTPSLAEKKVGIASPIEVEILNEFYGDMQVEADKHGIKLVIVDAGGDAIKQASDIEAFIAQGYDGIFFLLLDPTGFDEIIQRGVEQGICMLNHGASPITGSTQNVVLNQHAGGYQVGSEAARWINEKHGGEAEAGLVITTQNPQLIERSQGIRDALAELTPNAKIVGEVEGQTIDEGAAGAANLLQAHPDIKVLLTFNDDTGFGAYTAATEAGKTNPDEFFVGSVDGTELVLEKLAEGGIYHATAAFSFPFSSTQYMRDMVKCLRGEQIPPTRIMSSILITRENLEEYREIVDDPQDPEVQYLYDELMQYSDEPLQSPGQ
jgi:ribose transport system substrate-binding protein